MAKHLLVTVLLKDQVLQQHGFDKPVVKIGRHRACDVILDNPAISRVHATISLENDALYLQDHGSANGLLLNDRAASHDPLRDGDVITIGKFTLHIAIPSDRESPVDTHCGRDLTFRVEEPRPKK